MPRSPVLFILAHAETLRSTNLRRFKGTEANQGVTVDAQQFYAITNHANGKYRKHNGERAAGREDAKDAQPSGQNFHLPIGSQF